MFSRTASQETADPAADSKIAAEEIFDKPARVETSNRPGERGRSVDCRRIPQNGGKDSKANPLVGLWREESQTKCSGNATLTPISPIEELEFRADNTFAVTWEANRASQWRVQAIIDSELLEIVGKRLLSLISERENRSAQSYSLRLRDRNQKTLVEI